MANVNVTQLRSILQGMPTGALVTIHAKVLLSLLDKYKVSAGSEVVVTAEIPGTNRAPVDLSAF